MCAVIVALPSGGTDVPLTVMFSVGNTREYMYVTQIEIIIIDKDQFSRQSADSQNTCVMTSVFLDSISIIMVKASFNPHSL